MYLGVDTADDGRCMLTSSGSNVRLAERTGDIARLPAKSMRGAAHSSVTHELGSRRPAARSRRPAAPLSPVRSWEIGLDSDDDGDSDSDLEVEDSDESTRSARVSTHSVSSAAALGTGLIELALVEEGGIQC